MFSIQDKFFSREVDEESIHMESISQRGGKPENWDDIGLSNNPMNDRYFSQPDLDTRSQANRSRRHSEEIDPAKLPRSNSDRQSKIEGEGVDIDLAQFEYPMERNQVQSRRVGNPRFIKSHHAHRRRDGMRSSAMSDTSEAPSLASHVRRVRVPSQASDVDQFLDDLFMPVLDGNIDDGLSDARSLAASMRGGGDVVKSAEDHIQFNRIGSLRRRQSVLLQGSDSDSESESGEFSGLNKVSHLVSLLRGGSPTPAKDSQTEAKRQIDQGFTPMTSSAMGFHPIPGVISPHPGMMSPPPMMMPTPIQGNQFFSMGSTSPMMMPQDQPAMAYTYVPVPVYNLGGMAMPGGIPGMSGMPGMPGMQGMAVSGGMPSMNFSSMSAGGMNVGSPGPASPTKVGDKSEQQAPAATSTPMSPQASNIG